MTVATNAQKKLLHIVLMLNVWVISSIEKSTPPIGEPKATATPAALAAVTISRILPNKVLKVGTIESRRPYLGFLQSLGIDGLHCSQYNTQHAQTALLCPLTIRMQLQEAVNHQRKQSCMRI